MTGIARETLVFRREGFPPSLSLLIPTFAFPYAPEQVTLNLQGDTECSPTKYHYFRGFGIRLHTRLLSTHGPSTSELLRTL